MIPRLVRSWFWLHLLSTAAILVQPSTPTVFLGRYSRTSFPILIAFVVSIPVAWFGSRWLATQIEQERITLPRWPHMALLIICTALLFIVGYATTGVTDSYLIISWYLDYVLITIGVWSLQYLFDNPPHWIAHIGWLLAIITCLITLILAAHFPGLLWNDEGYQVTTALGFLRDHRLWPLYWRPATTETSSTMIIGQALWLQLFGVSLSVARTYTFLIDLISLGVIFEAARRVYSRSAAAIAVILGAIVLLNNNHLRVDPAVGLYLSLALLCYVLAQQKNLIWLHFVAGVVVGFSLDGHPNAYRFVIGFGLAYAVEYARLLIERRRVFIYWPLILLGVGEVLGVAGYIGLYTLLTPASFGKHVSSPGIALDLSQAPRLIVEQFNAALIYATLLLGSALLGAILAIRRSNPLERLLIVVLITNVLVMAIAFSYYRTYYLTQIVVLLALLATGLYYRLEQGLPIKIRAQIMSGVTTLILIAAMGWLAQKIRTTENFEQALTVVDQIRAVVPTDSVFVGIDPFYLRMYDYPNFKEFNVGGYTASEFNLSQKEAWEKIMPTAIAIVRGYPAPPPQALLDYITDHHFERIRCWDTQQLGRIELFMLSAPEGVSTDDSCQTLQ